MSVQSWLNRIWYERRCAALVAGAAVLDLRRVRSIAPLSVRQAPAQIDPDVGAGDRGGEPERRRHRQDSVGVLVGRSPGGAWIQARSGHPRLRRLLAHARIIDASDDPTSSATSRYCWRAVPAAPVAVGRDRPAAAQLLVNAGCDVMVSDDGLQHYALARDCEIVVVDGERRFGNGSAVACGAAARAEGRGWRRQTPWS